MRYGHPSIEEAMGKLKNCENIYVLPLFPQYSSAATDSAIQQVWSVLSKNKIKSEITVLRDFYQHPAFIAAYTERIQNTLAGKKVDCILMSYHGLPERHIIKSGCGATCDRVHACPTITDKNQRCYRAQCFITSDLIAKTLNLESNQYRVAFQSRLGRTPWIKPYTDIMLPTLIKEGIQNIALVSPSFVTDCLETLEEINIRLREQWQQLGGKEFIFIPSLNSEPGWINALKEMVHEIAKDN